MLEGKSLSLVSTSLLPTHSPRARRPKTRCSFRISQFFVGLFQYPRRTVP